MKRRKESGFALLMVFLMAACVAIMLYMEMPRVAFEAERQKELLLTDRGNQFKRAIQVFVTDKAANPTGRFPATIDELENFNNHRYLRRRYVDPMTGKDEWRLIHTSGSPGVFPDSVTMKTNQNQSQNTKDSGSTGSDYINVLQSFDAPSSQPQQQGGVNAALRRRPSDSAGGPGSLDGGTPAAGGSQGTNGDASGSGNPGPAGSLGLPGGGGTGASGPGGATGQTQPCMAYIGNTCVSSLGPPTGVGAFPGQAGNPVSLQAGGLAGNSGTPGGPQMTLPGVNGQAPGMQTNSGPQTAAAGLIQGLLTSPRPGGMPLSNPGTIVGGGIAGVASKFEAEGIMVINNRTAINEWEYIFDITKYRKPGSPLGAGPGTPANGTPTLPGATNPLTANPLTGNPTAPSPTATNPGGGQ